MLDFKDAYNITETTLGTTKLDVKAWGVIDYVRSNFRDVCRSGGVSWTEPGGWRAVFYIESMEVGVATTPAQRYWYPRVTGGQAFMSTVPKVEAFFPVRATPGEPMLLRYWFWADYDRMGMTQLFSTLNWAAMQKAASDIIEKVVPIPETATPWTPPIWRTLPGTLPNNPVSRAKMLMAEQR